MMNEYVGVDWAGKQWVVSIYDGDHLECEVLPTIFNIWQKYGKNAERILVDIPIGLTSGEIRNCDMEAKAILSEAGLGSSLFYTPTRPAVQQQTIEDAKEVQNADYSIQNQAWSIVPRIREVDVFLQETEDARDVILESHPELCFLGLDNRSDDKLGQKSGSDGIDDRQEILRDHIGEGFDDDYDEIKDQLMEPQYAPALGPSNEDDILDSIVMALTAKKGDFASLPEGEDSQQYDPVLGGEKIRIYGPPKIEEFTS